MTLALNCRGAESRRMRFRWHHWTSPRPMHIFLFNGGGLRIVCSIVKPRGWQEESFLYLEDTNIILSPRTKVQIFWTLNRMSAFLLQPLQSFHLKMVACEAKHLSGGPVQGSHWTQLGSIRPLDDSLALHCYIMSLGKSSYLEDL